MDFVLAGRMFTSIGETWMLIRNNGSLDNLVGKMYKSAGLKNLKLGVTGFDFEEDLTIHGDCVIKINFSDKTRKIMNEIYSKNRDISDLFSLFLRKEEPEVSIDVEITKDPITAKIFRKQIQEKFREAP